MREEPWGMSSDACRVVKFWATWCGSCRASFPHLQEAYEHYQDHPDVAFLLVNTSWGDTHEAAVQFLAQEGYTFPVAWDEGGRVAEAFGVENLPALFVIDQDGRIRKRKTGFRRSSDSAASYSTLIEKYIR